MAVRNALGASRGTLIRQHLMERSFARACRFGFDHARWRGLWRVRIQEYLTATIQNIQVLMRYGGDPRRRLGVLMREIKPADTLMQGIGRMMIRFLHRPSRRMALIGEQRPARPSMASEINKGMPIRMTQNT